MESNGSRYTRSSAGPDEPDDSNTDLVAPENYLGWVVQIAMAAGLRYWIHLASHGRVVELEVGCVKAARGA